MRFLIRQETGPWKYHVLTILNSHRSQPHKLQVHATGPRPGREALKHKAGKE